jgi:hypothetical protein
VIEPGSKGQQIETSAPIGYKRGEEVSPETVLGKMAGEMPPGMTFYIRKSIAEMAKAQKVVIGLYKMEKPPGAQKDRKVFIAEFPDVPTDRQIQELRPDGGKFRWFGNGFAANGEPCEWMSEEIFIEPAIEVRAAGNPVNPQGTRSQEVARTSHLSEEDIEDRQFQRFARYLGLMKELQGPTPIAAMEKAMDKISIMMEKQIEGALGSAMKLSERVREKSFKAASRAIDEAEAKPAEPMGNDSPLPEWLTPWMPKIETLVDKLLGGGLVAKIAAKTALGNAEVVEFFKDDERLDVLANVLTAKYGEEKATEAFEILLKNMPEETQVPQTTEPAAA